MYTIACLGSTSIFVGLCATSILACQHIHVNPVLCLYQYALFGFASFAL